MDIINKKTTLDDIKKFLSENGYECDEVVENRLIFTIKGVKSSAAMMPSGNILFMITLQLKDGLNEYDVLKKVNEINFQIISGNLSVKDGVAMFCYTLIRPYGMGAKSFKEFVDYHTFTMSYIVEELGLSEITK
ncbi:hypothetical protein SMY53_000534 [Cronobacter malonaticus]|nr:hypothetical protein [Cronobacter malonaticus]